MRGASIPVDTGRMEFDGLVVGHVPPAAAVAGEEFGVECGGGDTVEEVFVRAVSGDMFREGEEVFAAVLEAGTGKGEGGVSGGWSYVEGGRG